MIKVAIATPTYEHGDTVRFRVTFRDWAEEGTVGEIVDPTAVAVRLYNADKSLLAGPFVPVTVSSGVYSYDWTLPDEVGTFFIEFIGTLDGKPCVERQKVQTKWDVVV